MSDAAFGGFGVGPGVGVFRVWGAGLGDLESRVRRAFVPFPGFVWPPPPPPLSPSSRSWFLLSVNDPRALCDLQGRSLGSLYWRADTRTSDLMEDTTAHPQTVRVS